MKKIVSFLTIVFSIIILTSCGNKQTLPKHLQFQELNEEEFVITGYNPGLPKNVVLPKTFLGKPVTRVGKDAFRGSDIKSVVIPESYTILDEGAFFSSPNLKKVIFLGESQIVEIRDKAFWGNLSLEKITIPKSVTTIGDLAFYENVSLNNVSFEEESSVTKIGDLAFSRNYKLKTFTVPKSVRIIGENIFSRSNKLEAIIVDNENLKYTSVDGVLYNKDKTILISYPQAKKDDIYNVIETVNEISDNAFYEANNLEEIVLHNEITIIGNYAFTNIKTLIRIVIPNSVLHIGDYAFRDSKNLTIFTEFDEEQISWSNLWNSSNLDIYYNGTWHYNELNQPTINN